MSTYYGPVTRTNITDPTFYGHCESCHATICVGEVFYIHDGTDLDFCSPACLTKEINRRMLDAEHERIAEITSGSQI